MITKKKLIQSLKNMPESFSIDDLLDRVIFLQKVETGLSQSEKGQTISTKEAKLRMKKWFK